MHAGSYNSKRSFFSNPLKVFLVKVFIDTYNNFRNVCLRYVGSESNRSPKVVR
jgi:hypothetical protein